MRISVLQWNILYKEDLRNIGKFLVEKKPDIFCLQELTINYKEQVIKEGPKYLADLLGYEYYFVNVADLKDTDGGFGNGIFSKFPIVSKRTVMINTPTGTSKYDDEYRALVEATLDINGKELTVATTHMSYTHKFEVSPRKKAETDELIKLVKSKDKAFILTGDFNATPDSYVIKKLEEYFKKASPDYSEPTWTTKPFDYDGFTETELRWRLDYVLTSKDVNVVSTDIPKTDYSDHLPIHTVIDI